MPTLGSPWHSKGKRLPVVVCTFREKRLESFALRWAARKPPVGKGNASILDSRVRQRPRSCLTILSVTSSERRLARLQRASKNTMAGETARVSFPSYLQRSSSPTHRWVRHNDYEQALVDDCYSQLLPRWMKNCREAKRTSKTTAGPCWKA